MDTEERLIAETSQANRALSASGQSDMGCACLCRQAG